MTDREMRLWQGQAYLAIAYGAACGLAEVPNLVMFAAMLPLFISARSLHAWWIDRRAVSPP